MANEDLNTAQREERDFDLKAFLLNYMRYWYLFAISLFLAFMIAKYYNWYKNPVFGITAKMLVKDERAGKDRFLRQLEVEAPAKNIENEIEILRSHDLMAKALGELNFEVSYFLVGDVKVSEVYKDSPFRVEIDRLDYAAYAIQFFVEILDNDRYTLSYETKNGVFSIQSTFGETIDIGLGRIALFKRPNFPSNMADPTYEKRNYKLEFNTISYNQSKYLSKLNVGLSRPQSTILQIYIEDEVPQKALDFINALISVYLENDVDIKNKAAGATAEFLDEQLTAITTDLESIETSREEYKVSKGIVDLQSESKTVLEGIRELDERKALNETRLILIRQLRKYIVDNQDLEDLAPAVMGIDDPLLVKLINKLTELQSQREILINSSTVNNPKLLSINAEIQLTRASLLENIRNIERALDRKAEEIETSLSGYQGRIRRIPTTERELLEIERRFRIQESLYVFLLEKRAELSISLAATESDTRVVDKPYVLPGPIAPVPQRAYSIALLLGIFIPVLSIFLVEKLNDKVMAPGIIKRLTQVPIIGTVSYNKDSSPLVTVNKPRSAIAEEFRNIRTNLSFFPTKGKAGVYLVTSSIGTEGKTFTAMNLAGVLAASGARTILVGLDLRKPRIVENFGVENNLGCSTYLSGHVTLDDIIHPATQAGFPDLLPSGPTPPNPSELILSERMRQLISELSARYDKIVIDTPPVGLVSDGFVLAQYSDVVLFVVREGVTRRGHLEHVEELRRKGRLQGMAIVFNAMRKGSKAYGYAGAYGYGYGYGYGQDYGHYFEEEPPTGWRRWWKRSRKA